MKRITLYVDCKDDEVERVREAIESFRGSLGLPVTVLDVRELVSGT
jgi:hypothetical protein